MIENIDSIIRNLNQRLGGIVGTDFALDKVSESNASRIFQTHGNALALNRLEDGTTGEVSVYNWFGEYYIFMEIKILYGVYVPKGKRKVRDRMEQISVSISVFKKISDFIIQIFRAEWDDYAEATDGHPQPHWHFTADTALSRTFKEYAQRCGDNGFMQIIAPKENDISELKEMHFAMNGQWAKQQSHIHKMESDSDLISWIGGVLDTIRKEIRYANAT
ncbi:MULTISPECIES: hypothetical protein [Bacteroidales]|uniref:hypothetical protein n=1 Tax=Bacteroidales TaxID=171549 RepID=UPI000F460220|nr:MULTISPECIES: hypothetical protein [Bacteroidales]ROT04482.1 hypothetical protein EEL42_10970 [Muribaculaceae bacterium Isolate-100 (HZI)]RXE64240.1 hypothetical protein ED388_12215 [Muribaculaceae bacterium Isolate-007 (NCI)]TGX79807.1 hypothetical protein E5360_11660 [Muribaculum intestinale]